MKPQHVMIDLRSTRRMLAWSALIAIALVLALLLQSLAASALVAPGPVALSAACQAALAAGDNQRESFLEHSCVEGLTMSPSAQPVDLGPLVTPERCGPVGSGYMDSSIVAESRKIDCGWAP